MNDIPASESSEVVTSKGIGSSALLGSVVPERPLLDWAETLLCNAVPAAHCSEDEWCKLLKGWRDAKHGVEPSKPEDRWNAEHPVVVRLSEAAYEAERLKEKLARIRALRPYMREPEEQMLHRVLSESA